MMRAVMLRGGLAALAMALWATGPAAAAEESYKLEEVVHYSCKEAWQAVGESDQKLISLVTVLADHSINVRKLKFPDTQEAGDQLGDIIIVFCYEYFNEEELKTFKPRLVFVDGQNRIVEKKIR